MTYRGVPFLVTERAGARSAEPPRASGRPLLPRRLSGIRFSTSARRTSQGLSLIHIFPFRGTLAAAQDTPALLLGDLDVVEDLVHLALVNLAAHLGVVLPGQAHLHLAEGACLLYTSTTP